eukprot:GEMP01007653.1.p1 GENE.GEMP01007653.1~~GEMP01007653.1.p1  ORF type:complete len:717 (+),score=166.83 GEMP01007653.1:27-2177(+)
MTSSALPATTSAPDDDSSPLTDSSQELRVWYHVFLRSYRAPRALRRWHAKTLFRRLLREADAHRRGRLVACALHTWRLWLRATHHARSAAAQCAVAAAERSVRRVLRAWCEGVVARRRRARLISGAARVLRQRRGFVRWRAFCAYQREQQVVVAAHAELIDIGRKMVSLRRLGRHVVASHRVWELELKMRKFTHVRRLQRALRGWVDVTRVTLTRTLTLHIRTARTRHLRHWYILLRTSLLNRHFVLCAALARWRVASTHIAQAAELRARHKISKFQRCYLRRWLAGWRSYAAVGSRGVAAHARHRVQCTQRYFTAWHRKRVGHLSAKHMNARQLLATRRAVLHSWLQWTHARRAMFLNSLHLKALVRTRALRKSTWRWHRCSKVHAFTHRRAHTATRRLMIIAMMAWRDFTRRKVVAELYRRKAVGARYHFVLRLYLQAMKKHVLVQQMSRFNSFCLIHRHASHAALLAAWERWVYVRPQLRRNFTLPRQQYLVFLLRRAFGALSGYRRRRIRVRVLAKRLISVRAQRAQREALASLTACAAARRHRRDARRARVDAAARVVQHMRMRQVLRLLADKARIANKVRHSTLLAWGFRQKWLVAKARMAWRNQILSARQQRHTLQWALHCGIFHRQKRKWFRHWVECAALERWERRFGGAAMLLWYAHTLRRSFHGWSTYVTRRMAKKQRQHQIYSSRHCSYGKHEQCASWCLAYFGA